MGKTVPMASFRRATRMDSSAVSAFVELGDAPGDTPVPVPEALQPSNEVEATPVEDAHVVHDVADPTPAPVESVGVDPAPRAPVTSPNAKEEPRRAAAPKWRRKTLVREDGRELRKQTIYLEAELSHRLMVTCAQNQYELSEAIGEAVNLWLKKKG